MPKYIKHKKTYKYSNEFKVKAVQLSHLDGVQVKDIAEALDIHPFMLSRHMKCCEKNAPALLLGVSK